MAAKTKAEENVPGPDTFDFDSYISGTSTFPEFSHTIYLDQASGIELARTADEYTALAKRGKAIERRRRVMSESTTSLVDDEWEKLAAELEDITVKTDALEIRMKDLETKVKASGLTLTFQVGTAQKLGKVVRRAEKEYQKKHGKGSNDDVEHLTNKGRYLLVAQLAAYCTKITLPDGTDQQPPSAEGFESLMDRLISSESARLMMALNKALDSSGEWADRVDAGFPGGSHDLGEESMGDSGSEDSEVLVDSSIDAPDGKEKLLER